MRHALCPLCILFAFAAGCVDHDEKIEGDDKVEQDEKVEEDDTVLFPVLTESDIREIRMDPKKVDDLYPQFRRWAEESHHDSLSELSDSELFALYSAFVAYSMAPYGCCTKLGFQDLLNEQRLSCNKYAILTYYLFLKRANATGNDVEFRFVGWDGGAVGNHCQVFVVSHRRSIMLDPTIGIAAFADFNTVASGKPLPRDQIIDFSTRTELEDYRQRVIDALVCGRYKPSDLLYFFEEFDEFRTPISKVDGWPTPGAYTFRKRNHKVQ